MNKEDILQFYEYNYWATFKVLNAAAKISTEQFIAPMGLTFGSIRGPICPCFGSRDHLAYAFSGGHFAFSIACGT